MDVHSWVWAATVEIRSGKRAFNERHNLDGKSVVGQATENRASALCSSMQGVNH